MEEYRLPVEHKSQHPLLRPEYKRRNRPRQGRFVKGPIPLIWLQAAMKLSGACLSAGIILWHLRGLKRSVRFKIGVGDIANLIGRSWVTAQRALLALERAELIMIERHEGRKHIVTIREIDENGAAHKP